MESQQTALDMLRTVEFRETLRGYHRDDVDEYLERAAQEAEGLQEQLRQAAERLQQAADRVAELEARVQQQGSSRSAAAPAVNDDTLQRTLLLAQKFVDQTKSEAEAEAARMIAEAEEKVKAMASDADRLLREDVSRLERSRAALTVEVDEMSRHLESERLRLKATLTGILHWVDENVQPAAFVTERSDRPAGGDEASSGSYRPAEAAGGSAGATGPSEDAQVDFFSSSRPSQASQPSEPAIGRDVGDRPGEGGPAGAEARATTPVRSSDPIDTATRMHA